MQKGWSCHGSPESVTELGIWEFQVLGTKVTECGFELGGTDGLLGPFSLQIRLDAAGGKGVIVAQKCQEGFSNSG